MSVDRRKFLSLAGASVLAACSRSGPAIHTTRKSALTGTAGWGSANTAEAAAFLPSARQPSGVLEVFLLGGLSPWESFYTVPEYGDPAKAGAYAGQAWWSFQDTSGAAVPTLSVPTWWSACGRDGEAMTVPLAADALGAQVHLGPFVHALRDRPDVLKRMRVWVMSHDVEPHEAAIPQAIGGQRLGNPRLAALGTHLERFHSDRAPRSAPYSVAISMSALDVSTNNATAATAVGLHPAAARPIGLQLGPDTRLPRQLPRPTTAGYRDTMDAYLAFQLEAYRSRLPGTARAPALDSYAFARTAMRDYKVLSQLLPADKLQSAMIDACLPDPEGWAPGDPLLDEVTTSLKLGAHLLTHPDHAARYVQVLDSGLNTDPVGQGYDAHGSQVVQTAPNIAHTLDQLLALIAEPGDDDPTKLNLDDHFVLLNTEFGRAPVPEKTPRNPDGGGTNHWPWGYVVVGFGGPIGEDQAGVVGAIGENSRASVSITPSEHRAAMLLMNGVWPFTAESFAVGDVRDVATELDAAMAVRELVWGA